MSAKFVSSFHVYQKTRKGICAIALALIMAAVSFLPVLEGMVPQAEAAPSGSMPIYSWGQDARLGRSITGAGSVPANEPGRVGDLTDWTHAATSSSISGAINSSGELFAWGNNGTNATMGQGPGAPSTLLTEPTQVGIDTGWTDLAAVGSTVAGINDGKLYRWGSAASIWPSQNVPVQLGTATNWVQVSVSTFSVHAINSLGELWVIGANSSGMFGLGDANPRDELTQVGDRTDWAMVAATNSFMAVLDEDGNIYSAGTASQLGRATTGVGTVPGNALGRVEGGQTWIDVRPTSSHVAAINDDGELFTWGGAGNALGRPTTPDPANRPGKVGIANDWVSVHGGFQHFLAFNEAQELWGWGANESGQIGDGSNTGRGAPVLILQTYGFNSAARGGGTHSLMLLRSTPAEGENFLTKNLQMPYGTPAPDLNFTFIIAPHSFNGNTAQTNLLPTIPNRVVSINNTSDSDTNAGITTLTDNVDVLEGITFGQSGVFSYTVTEQQNTSGAAPPSTVTYSQAQYRLNIYVQRNFELPGEVYEIVAITVYRHINDNGTAVAPPEKDLNGLIFTNQYRRTTSGTTEYPGGLRLTKTVAGEFADRTTPFDFDVTLTRTAMCPPTSNFQARIYNADGTLNSTVPITSGVSTHLTLRHRQSVVFQSTALPASTLTVGTGFTITERAAANFVASVELYVGDAPITVAPNTLPNTALSTGARIIGDNRNSADFTNTHLFTPPVGLAVGNPSIIPFLAVGLLGVIVLIFFTLKARRQVENLPTDIDRLPAENMPASNEVELSHKQQKGCQG